MPVCTLPRLLAPIRTSRAHRWLDQPPTLRSRTTPAKSAKSKPSNPPAQSTHPTLHAPPPQLKKHPQLWITVTAIFNVIFLIELLVNWYGSVWCAATLHPKLESEHQPSS